MKSSSYANNNKTEGSLSIANKRVFKLPTALPKRIAALRQSLASSPTIKSNDTPNATGTKETKSSSPSLVSPYVLSIANTMKLRMKAAVNTMVWNGNRRDILSSSSVSPSAATDTVTATPLPLCDLQQQKKQTGHRQEMSSLSNLKNGALLRQYLTFVQEETGVMLDMDLSHSPTAATGTNDCYEISFETQQKHPSHSLASSGAALIESLVHRSPYTFDSQNLSVPTTMASSTKPTTPQRRTSRPIKSTSVAAALKVEEEEKRFKKSERLRLKQQRQSTWTPLKTTTVSNMNKKEYASPPDSTAAVIKCICARPHEEFGAMVQCDDCKCWLHLECLALDEDALDDTFRCPSCSISLGPGEHLTSAVTWRVAAQLKSQHLAERRHTTTETMGKRKRKNKQQSHRPGSGRRHLLGNLHPPQRHYRAQQRKQQYQKERCRRRQYPRQSLPYSIQDLSNSSSYSSSDSDNENIGEAQNNKTWMIPKMTIHSSISTTMTTSTGNVLVQKLNNHGASVTAIQQNEANTYDNNDTDVDMEVDSDTTESDWETGDRYQQYQHPRSSIYDEADEDYDYDYQHKRPASTSTRASFSSINTTPSLTLSPSHTGSDTESPCEASTPPDEGFGHDDTYIQAIGHSMNNSTTTATNSIAGPRVILSTTATSACLDQESLIWLSRLAYLESLQSSTRQQCFNPHASDVFLCGDQQQHQQQQERHQQKCYPTVPMTAAHEAIDDDDTNGHHHYSQLARVPLLASITTRSDPPSTICSHDLSQFSFDAGPFWSPLQ